MKLPQKEEIFLSGKADFKELAQKWVDEANIARRDASRSFVGFNSYMNMALILERMAAELLEYVEIQEEIEKRNKNESAKPRPF